LLRHGRSILDTVSLAEAEVAAIAGLRAGRVRLAAFPSAAATIVASAMATMMGTFPGVTFTLTEAEPARAVDLVERGECDIAVVFHYSTFEASANDNLAWIPLMEEAVHIVLPGEHPLVDAEEVALTSLRDSRWIAGCPDCRGYLVQACHRAGFAPDIAFETDDYVALQNLALRGLGVALLPDLVLAAVRLDGLHVRPLKQDDTRMVSAVSTRAFATVPGIRETLNSLRRECAPEGPWLNASGRSSS
jgi:DNA-binding transcriptional LysR family regulator